MLSTITIHSKILGRRLRLLKIWLKRRLLWLGVQASQRESRSGCQELGLWIWDQQWRRDPFDRATIVHIHVMWMLIAEWDCVACCLQQEINISCIYKYRAALSCPIKTMNTNRSSFSLLTWTNHTNLVIYSLNSFHVILIHAIKLCTSKFYLHSIWNRSTSTYETSVYSEVNMILLVRFPVVKPTHPISIPIFDIGARIYG